VWVAFEIGRNMMEPGGELVMNHGVFLGGRRMVKFLSFVFMRNGEV